MLFAVLFSAGGNASQAQLSNPIPTPIVKQGLRAKIVDVVQFPDTLSSVGKPDHRPESHARLNFLRESPDGRLFVNDLRGQLYRLDENYEPQLYLDIDSVNGQSGSIFPATWYSNGLAAGFVSYTFHPEFETNGLFYTLHMERASSTSAVPDFSTTDLGNPPQGVNWHTVLTEWSAADPLADSWNESTGTRREVLRVGTTATAYFHPFGDLQFNPNASPGSDDYGLLYVSGGDWGYINGAGAPQDPDTEGQPGQTQRLDTLAGTLIRIDPRSPSVTGGQPGLGDYTIPADNPFVDGDPNTFDEVYAFGFRNGHRMAWDTDSTLFVSSVGHANIEEIERIVPGGNYGWVNREGTFVNGNDIASGGNGDADVVFANNVPDSLDVDFRGQEYLYPVVQYDHGEGFANSGGFVYRGSLMPELQGKFIFGDIVNGRVFAADVDQMKSIDLTDPSTTGAIEEIQLFTIDEFGGEIDVDLRGHYLPGRVDLRLGLDDDGELWVITKEDGYLRRLVSRVAPEWSVNGGGAWNTGANWSNGLSPVAGTDVVFGSALTASQVPATITLDAPAVVSQILFQNSNQYRVTGTGSLKLAGPALLSADAGVHEIAVGIQGENGLTKTGSGTVALAGAASDYHGDTRIAGGTLALSGAATLSNTPHIHVMSGAVFDVTAAASGEYALSGQALTVDGEVHGGIRAQSGSTVRVNSASTVVGNLIVESASMVSGAGTVVGNVSVGEGTIQVGGAGLDARLSQFVIDDFEGYQPGLVRNVADPPWTAHGNTMFAAIENAGAANRALTYGWSSDFRGASRQAPSGAAIGEGEVATLFFRFNSKTDAPDHSLGLADQASTAGASFSDFEAQVRLTDDAQATGTFVLDARSGAGFTAPLAAGLTPNTWYNVWMVVDQSTDTYDVYLSTGATDATASNRVASGLQFRNGTTDALDQILGLSGPAAVDYGVRFDDLVYLHGEDLTNPLSGLSPILLGSGATLTIEGDLTLAAAGTLALDIATPAVADRLAVAGELAAGGALVVTLHPGAPILAMGDAFDLLDAGSTSGAFDELSLPNLPLGLAWNTSQLLVNGVLSVGLPGDYNGDGSVDAADYTVWRDNLSAPAGTLSNDSAGGQIGLAQYLLWRDSYGLQAPDQLSDAGAAPEPSCFLLLLGLPAALVCRSRCLALRG